MEHLRVIMSDDDITISWDVSMLHIYIHVATTSMHVTNRSHALTESHITHYQTRMTPVK